MNVGSHVVGVLATLLLSVGCGRIGYDALSSDAGLTDADPKLQIDADTNSKASIQLAGGWYHMCALHDGKATCWGDDVSGQLGGAIGGSVASPAPVAGLPGLAQEITAGQVHSCALVDGNAYCWGSNADGRLGNDDAAMIQPATLVTTLAPNSVTSISAGHNFTCAISAGDAYCWGFNGSGQLGTGNNMSSATPLPVLGLPVDATVKFIDAGEDHACAVIDTGRIYCWGHDDNGALGAGVGSTTSAVLVQTLTNASMVTIAGWHACALQDEAAHCWGSGTDGELGNGMNVHENTPVAVPSLSDLVSDIACAGGPADRDATCAIRVGVVQCWGNNQFGRLGDGTTMISNVPLPVAGLPTGAISVVGGMDHFCALLDDDSVWCWGRGAEGQLGDGKQTDSFVPVAVTF
jgi:alpha-tubulin suppressor-like RCC1 family protein